MRDEARPRPDRGQRRPAAVVVPPKSGGAFRWIALGLMAVSTLSLLAIAGLTGLVYLQLKATDVAGLKQDIAGVKTETAALHADVGKSLQGLQKGLSDTANQVNSATLELNDIALSLHNKP